MGNNLIVVERVLPLEVSDLLRVADSALLDALSSCVFSPQLLEYTGKGKSIVDVGLAQARRPLNTRFHYYELEITDAGEKCYIALGLAGRVNIPLI